MSRTLSPALSAAVSASTRSPIVALSAEDHINHLQQSVVTMANTDTWFDACVAPDGGIVRIQVQGGGSGFANNVQYQRVTDPTVATQWTTWTTFSGGAGNMNQNGGVAISNNAGTLRAFAQQGTGGNAIFVWTSSNNGVSWTGPVTVLSPPASALTKGLSSAGNNDLFLLYDIPGNNQLGCSFFSGGVWSALHSSTLPTIPYVGQHTGIAAVWSSAATAYTVVYSSNTALQAVSVSSNGATWAQLLDVVPATNQNIQRLAPRITFFDGLYQLVCIEADSGTYTGTAYQYPRVRQSADLIHWSTGFILHDMTAHYGAVLLKTTPPAQSRARYIASTQQLIELGLDYQQSDSTQYLNLAPYILEYRRSEELDRPARMSLVLDNTSGALTSFVTTYGLTTYGPIGLNSTLVLSEGYRTGVPPSNPELIAVARYHIRQIIFERAPGQSHLRIEAEDLTRLFDRVNRYQVTYANQTLAWMIGEICARAGLFSVNLPVTAQLSGSVPAFVLHAGQHFRAALDELCRVGWLEYFLDQNETLQFRELAPTDPAVWSYAPEIETFAIGGDDQRANHIIVSGRPPTGVGSYFGALTNGEAYDDTHLHTTGVERLITDSDPKLLTSAQCVSKAAFLLQQEQRSQIAHSITVPVNPALQLLDVLALADQAQPRGTGLAATARIERQRIHYHPDRAIFEQTINLEGV